MRELLIEKFEKSTDILYDGTMVWKNEDGEIHRENDMPAIIFINGDKYWCKNGLNHRDRDLPTKIFADDSRIWYKNGQRHRNGDKPAIIFASGTREWWKNGKFLKRIEKK